MIPSKRPLEDKWSLESKRTNASSTLLPTLENIPEDVGAHLFHFLDQADLCEISQVSRSLRNIMKHPALTGSRTVTINCNVYEAALDHGLLRLLKLLLSLDKMGKFAWFHSIRLNRPDRMTKSWPTRGIRHMIGEVQLTQVTSLDMSISRDIEKIEIIDGEVTILDFELLDCVPKMLNLLLPNLRHLDLSNITMPQNAVKQFLQNFSHLETLVWNYCENNVSIWGTEINYCNGLKELKMDDAIFFACKEFHNHEVISSTKFSFLVLRGYPSSLLSNSLERVSLKNMRYQIEGIFEVLPVPQVALMEFVRARDNLKWFRSDLTAENIAILKAEFPEVTFISE